ncbi:lariat debranching enzyme [Myriangium duriaei CBS 260.36]|uniref:Lariat debranching enzyme n=1 Tax=Myriangium duriaei CBS 260.36 TaxID=1168546 RepID=A0A9P4IV57_9PEZI|nr:lariat debranching enzyme [Myriangium duriaei CBS 260.36]
MSATELVQAEGLRIAVEGCGHGVLHSIYASIDKACEEAGWPGVDLVIIGGDFQAVRNADDLACVSIPPKYRSMQDFHEYYSGQRKAPYLTVFVGGNHEASNYLFELYYGGWVAPNIYYMGAANVLRAGPIRIAGMSGIWKGYDYRKHHFERLPYNQDEVKSIYHTRELDIRKLLNVRTQVDVGMSHDWPNGVEWEGNYEKLFKQKDLFEQDARSGNLGNKAARYVLDRLRPRYWFSAHLHVKYSAVVHHKSEKDAQNGVAEAANLPISEKLKNNDEIDLDMDDEPDTRAQNNPQQYPNNDEIDLDIEDDDAALPIEAPTGMNGAPEPISEDRVPQKDQTQVSDSLRAQLPAAFTRTKTPPPKSLPFPEDITNTTTKFLALDKCLPHRHFLQLMSIPPDVQNQSEISRPVKLEYDKEWLAICRVFASDLTLGDGDESLSVPKDRGEAFYRPLIDAEKDWVEQYVVKADKMVIPENFEATAPAYDERRGIVQVKMPREYTNNQTKAFCELLDISNPFDISEEERDARMRNGPKQTNRSDGGGGGSRRGFGGGRGGGGGRGRGWGRGRGHSGRGARR